MKVTRNASGLIYADGKPVDMYEFSKWLTANHLGAPSQASPEIIERFLTQRAADGACTCLYEVRGDDMSLDPDCPVHGSPRR